MLEVFDEFVLANNMAALKCQSPAHLTGQLDFVGWLKDDKLIAALDETRLVRRLTSGRPNRVWPASSSQLQDVGGQQQQQLLNNNLDQAAGDDIKHFMLRTGELFIRNASKSDNGSYRCRARHKLTGQLLSSRIGGQLLVEEPTDGQLGGSNSELKLASGEPEGQPRLLMVQQDSDVVLCARFQSHPVAKFTWFKLNPSGGEQLRLPSEHFPEIKQLDSCLVIGQAQGQRLSGMEFVCEASATSSLLATKRSSIRLFVGPTQPAEVRLTTTTMTTSSLQQVRHSPEGPPPTGQLVSFGAPISLSCSIDSSRLLLPRSELMVAWFKDAQLLALSPLGSPDPTSSAGNVPPAVHRVRQANQSHHLNVRLVQPTVIAIEPFGLDERGTYQCLVYYEAERKPADLLRQLTGSGNSSTDSSPRASSQSSERRHMLTVFERQLERLLHQSAGGSLWLDVAFSRPQLVGRFPVSQSLRKRAPLSLECAAQGLPLPKIVWFLDDFVIGGRPSEALEAEDDTDDDDGQQQLGLVESMDRQWLASANDWLASGAEQEVGSLQLGWQLANKQPDEVISDERFRIGWRISRPQVVNSQQQQQQLVTVVSQLNVSRLSLAESGHYKCLAINSLGHSAHSGRLQVLESGPTVELRNYQPSNVTLLAGRSGQLHCPLVGFPLGRVDWFRGDQRLPASHRQRVEPIWAGAGGQLELSNVDAQADAGLYSCRTSLGPAPNGSLETVPISETSSGSTVQFDDRVGLVRAQVRVAPLIDSQSLPDEVQANEGMRTKLVCSVVQGEHPVEIKWLRRVPELAGRTGAGGQVQVGRQRMAGFELMQNSDQELDQEAITLHNLEDSCLLTFKQVTARDSGDYLCLAQNQVSLSMRRVRLVVKVAPSWSLEPPDELAVLLGARLQVDCLAHGFPAPQVTWRRSRGPPEGPEVPSSSDMATKQQVPNSSDSFAELLLPSYRHRPLANGTLVIEQVELSDAGQLMCELTNGIGSGLSKVVRLDVKVPPHFKQQRPVSQLAQLNGQAELRCLVQGDQPMVVGWRKGLQVVDLAHDQRLGRLVREQRLGQQSFESVLSISNLTRDDSGQYECIASNEFGTEVLAFHLIVQEPPEAPIIMRPIRTGARKATLTLRQPFAGNSPIRKYSIHFKQLLFAEGALGELGEPSFNSSSSSPNNHHHDLINWQHVQVDAPAPEVGPAALGQLANLNLCCLRPFTRYLVKVRAINDIGQSAPSKAAGLMTAEEAIGGPPLDVSVEPTGAHSLKIRWRPPARQLQNGLIRGYYVGYRIAPSQHVGLRDPHPAVQQPPMLLAQLAPDQAASQQIQLADQEEQQYQYKNVQLDLSASSLRPAQQLPASLSASDWSLFEPSQPEPAAANQSSSPQVYTSYLTNLRRKTAYSIIVQAYNKVGAGPRSDQVVVSTLDAAPPMSPLVRLVSLAHNSVQLAWSGRRFNGNLQQQSRTATGRPVKLAGETGPAGEIHTESDNSEYNSNSNSNSNNININNSNINNINNSNNNNNIDDNDDDDADDPQAYYSLNFRLEPADRSAGSDEWQQRKLARRQPMPFVLNNLRCGSPYSAFMTATNSLGQSEPGETIRFNTLGAAPVAPSSSRDFLAVNSTYVVLRLAAWQNSGCLIGSFVIKFKLAGQAKWAGVLEHQIHPTIQTVIVAGSAVFSTRPHSLGLPAEFSASDLLDHSQDMEQRLARRVQSAPRQTPNDFVLRNLLAGSTYKLSVEANSEAGSTVAEYEFETANFTSTTLAINVNGLVAAGDQLEPSSGSNRQRANLGAADGGPLEGSTLNDFDPAGSLSNGRRSLGPSQRYALGVWSLTALFVIASILMAATTLVLGFRSIFRLKPIGSGSHESLLSAMFCCSTASSSSSGGSSTSGQDEGSHSSSAGAGACYQVPEAHMDGPYCTLPLHHHHLLGGGGSGSPNNSTRAAPTISAHLCAPHADHRAPSSQLHRHLVSSTSLSALASRQQYPGTLARLGPGVESRLSGDEGHEQQEAASPTTRSTSFRSAATLGRQLQPQQNSTFIQQPLKFNHSSPLYGRLSAGRPLHQPAQADQQQQQQVVYSTQRQPDDGQASYHFQAGSSATTTSSGYLTTSLGATTKLAESQDQVGTLLAPSGGIDVYAGRLHELGGFEQQGPNLLPGQQLEQMGKQQLSEFSQQLAGDAYGIIFGHEPLHFEQQYDSSMQN